MIVVTAVVLLLLSTAPRHDVSHDQQLGTEKLYGMTLQTQRLG